jgi:hypothetical protein
MLNLKAASDGGGVQRVKLISQGRAWGISGEQCVEALLDHVHLHA